MNRFKGGSPFELNFRDPKHSHGCLAGSGFHERAGYAASPERQPDSGPGQAVGANLGWLNDLKTWRAERLTRMGYDDAEYLRPEFQWAQHNFVSPQVMVEERTLFDVDTNRWTVDKYLDDLEKRYGGIDSVLLWPVYPNVGIDNRNRWDLARDLPGGVEGVRQMVQDFHRRNVRVLFPTMARTTVHATLAFRTGPPLRN